MKTLIGKIKNLILKVFNYLLTLRDSISNNGDNISTIDLDYDLSEGYHIQYGGQITKNP